MSKATRVLTQDWFELVEMIPDDLEVSARECQAQRRRRGIRSAADLLRVILLYATVHSLRLAAVWSAGLGVCDISRQAIEKRVLHSTEWLRHLVAVLLQAVVPVPADSSNEVKRLVLRDGSVISRAGSEGAEWRLHLSWQPWAQQPVALMLSDRHTGEGLADAGLQAGDLVLADRAYGIWREIRHVLQASAYLIILVIAHISATCQIFRLALPLECEIQGS